MVKRYEEYQANAKVTGICDPDEQSLS